MLLLIGTLCAGLVSAQTLKEVATRNLEARGGEKRIRAIETARFTGTMLVGGATEAEFTMEWQRPDHFRLEFLLGGQSGVQAFDGETAWIFMPFLGMPAPQVIPAEQAKSVVEQMDIIDGPFIDLDKKGIELELMGKQDHDGTRAYQVRVTRSGGSTDDHFFDAESFLEVRRENASGSIEFGDYREVGGVHFPHRIEQKAATEGPGQSITIKQVEFNIDIADGRFAMPPPPAAVKED
jgi:outer membrane lipoprotein-sorting protein